MKGYELTERGKIAIAVFLAILLIVLAVILAIRVWNGSGPSFNNQQPPQEPEQVYTPPEISNTPHPEDNETQPDGNPENGEQGSFDPPQEQDDENEPPESSSQEPGEEPDDTSEEEPEDKQDQEEESNEQPAAGSSSVNRSAGTMSFRFSPSSQDSLDADTKAMISDFLDSPRNTTNSQIVVSIPQLPEEETAKIISAVTDAFAEKGIAQRNLAFTIYRLSSGNSSYEIRLSFSQATSRK